MKKFLLYLSALFLSVSFANAQTQEYVISPSTGTLTGGKPSNEWVYTKNGELLADLTLTARNDGGDVKNIYYVSNDTKLSLNAYKDPYSTTTYTVSVPEDGKYKITGYSMTYTIYGKVSVENSINSYNSSSKGTMQATGLDVYSFSFTVTRINNGSQDSAIDISDFTVTLEQAGSAPAEEYTVSATAGVGGTVTINGGTDDVTTTDKVELVAVPNYGYKFVNWTVGTEEVSTSAEYTATVDSDTEFVANFAKFENTDEWYAAIEKPTFGKTGNTTFIKSATVDGVAVENIPEYIADDKAEGVARQSGVTTAIEATPGAQFNLNITYQLNWGDLAIYQIDNDGATKEYGYYFGSWTATDPNTGKVIENIANDDISVSDIVDGVCTVTYPISINENHNVGDVIVVRAITGVINNTTNSAYEQGIDEGGYVDFLFVVAEEEEPAFSHTLTVTETGYATLFLGFNAAIPAEVEAYTVTEINNGYVTLTKVEGVLPAGTGIIVKAEAGDYELAYSTENVADVTGNKLLGTTVDTDIDVEAYVLSAPDGIESVGLYKAKMTDGSWLNNANKAYLPASEVPAAVQGAASFSFRFGEGTTGISEVKGESGNVKTVYDLTGRRVEAITEPGIYIVNGKKVLVK